jgi:hypothetical protein
MTEHKADERFFGRSLFGRRRTEGARDAGIRRNDYRRRGDADNSMAEEKPVMKARMPKENAMTEVLMRNKKVVAQPMFVIEVMKVDRAGGNMEMPAVAPKRSL